MPTPGGRDLYVYPLLFHTISLKAGGMLGGAGVNQSNFEIMKTVGLKSKETVPMHCPLLCKATSHEGMS